MIEKRLNTLVELGKYMNADNREWQEVMSLASRSNAWFTEEHIGIAAKNIAEGYLQPEYLQEWLRGYDVRGVVPRTVGVVMAGNIPMVGFHDLLCGYVAGHRVMVKLSSKDEVLMRAIIGQIKMHDAEATIEIAERLTGADAYIATGSNNTSRYFQEYFGKYPNIIRQNRTSVAVLTGDETDEELSALADDVYLYFGLGCRNVTQVAVPRGYNFERLLRAMDKYNRYADFHKYKNNYDYHLALYLLNRVPYMSNTSLLVVENELPFSAVSVLHYKYYDGTAAEVIAQLQADNNVQAVVGNGGVPFGAAQRPSLGDYADGIDTMRFLVTI